MHAESQAAPAEILLVEDSEEFAYLTQVAFARAKAPANLHHVPDGRQAMQFLRREPPFDTAPAPDVVLLDIDMPVMDGRQVMAAIVGDEALRHLPVVILTSRGDPADVLGMYRLRCNSYIRKPVDHKRFVEVISTFADYWLSVVELPLRASKTKSPW